LLSLGGYPTLDIKGYIFAAIISFILTIALFKCFIKIITANRNNVWKTIYSVLKNIEKGLLLLCLNILFMIGLYIGAMFILVCITINMYGLDSINYITQLSLVLALIESIGLVMCIIKSRKRVGAVKCITPNVGNSLVKYKYNYYPFSNENIDNVSITRLFLTIAGFSFNWHYQPMAKCLYFLFTPDISLSTISERKVIDTVLNNPLKKK